MFNSSEAIVSMPCGHYLHQTCYSHYITPPSEHEEGAYQCPICKKSALNMEVKWRKLDSEIQQQPMPSHLRDMKVEIRCIDCEGRSIVNLHWLGNKCALCDGYNTVVVLELGREGDEAAAANELRRRVMRANMERRRGPAFMSQPRARRYFQDEDEEGAGAGSNTERPNSAAGVGGEVGIGFGSAAYEMLARMSRSLNADGDVIIDNNDTPDRPISAAGVGEAGFAFGTTAYEMLARMSRSLSPIRHYFDSDGEEAVRRIRRDGSTGEDDSEHGFWGESEGYIDDDDDDSSDDDDEYDSDDSLANEDIDDEEDEAQGHGLDELDLQLIGHR
jgi:Zinc-ribbon